MNCRVSGSVIAARVFKLLALDYDTLTTRGEDGNVTIQAIRTRESRYGPSLIEKFAALVGAAASTRELLKIPLSMVQPGMTIMEDVRTHLGTLLIARGCEVSPPFLERLRNRRVHPVRASHRAGAASEG